MSAFLKALSILAAAAAGSSFAQAETSALIRSAIADPTRPPEQVARDADRKPAEVVALSGLRPGARVADFMSGGGYFKALVSFHGLLETSMPAAPGAVQGQIAIYTGAKDPYAPAERVTAFQQEMTAAGARFQTTVFSEAAHALTDPNAAAMGRPGIAYDPIADSVSWAGASALLEATIG
jgi:predicted methyltransferase